MMNPVIQVNPAFQPQRLSNIRPVGAQKKKNKIVANFPKTGVSNVSKSKNKVKTKVKDIKKMTDVMYNRVSCCELIHLPRAAPDAEKLKGRAHIT